MKIVEGGVTKAKGFEAASTAAKIKYEGRTDMALIYSEKPCAAAGTFTTNVVKAAPVKWDRQVVDSGKPVHAVVVNSGIANACTGEEGMYYCEETARAAAEALGIPADHRTGEGAEIQRELLHAMLLRVKLDLRELPPEPENVERVPSVCRLSQLAKEYLDESFPQHFPDVAEVAQTVGCSPNYLSGVFRRDYGITLKKYINNMRFDYAKAMLENSRFNVSEVAGSCGFNDVSYFSRQFRSRFGHYPSQRR